jgi:hypothetical protein
MHSMKIYSLRLLILLLVLSPAASMAQEARTSYALSPGGVYHLDIEMQQNTRSESMNSEEINMYSSILLEFKVDSITPGKLIEMSVSYKKLHLSMLAPGMGIDINSESGNNTLLSEMMDSLQGQVFRLVMDESGELKSMVGLEAIFEKLAANPLPEQQQANLTLETLHEAYGPDAFQGLFNLFIAFYPSIQPIKNWTTDLSYYFNTKPVKITNRYFLTKTTGEVVTIQGMGMINAVGEYSETIALGEVTSTVSGTQTYDLQTEASSGWLIRCISKQKLVIETTVVKSRQLPVGLKIPSYTETSFEVKGSIH